ncbi:MAG: hypothetical protein OXU75_09595 [Deltaproteobacteria bacterium]|nr:hypothetical protein [Deltaproteobacteria bacterium]
MTSNRPGGTVPAGYEKVCPAPGLTMLVAPGLDGGALASRILNPGSGTRAPGQARYFGRAELHAVELADGGRALVRSCRHGGLLRHVTRDWFVSRPLRPFVELAVTVLARERGVPAPEVLAALVARGIGPWYRGWLVTREIEGARNLWAALLEGVDGDGKRALLRQVGHSLRLMHTSGIDHADLNLRNILVLDGAPGPEIFIIDFDKARLFKGTVPAARARRNLQRLRRSVDKLDRGHVRVRPQDWDALVGAYETPLTNRR